MAAPAPAVPGRAALHRRDRPLVYPANVVVWLTLFSAYSLWTIVFFTRDSFHQYLSPFYSPLIAGGRIPVSPALLIFWVPLGFRATCYYYRKAYYRAFFQDPPACALLEPQLGARVSPTGRGRSYRGESRLPFVLSNLHRLFLYLAIVFVGFFVADTVQAFSDHGRVGIGLGTALILVNTVALALYTFSCHSLRHLVGGGLDCFSCARAGRPRFQLWRLTSWLNLRHSVWAWVSLTTVVLTDLYIRLLQYGVIHDPHAGF